MKRVLMFPEPFPDEDFRSIIFRYHLRSSNIDFSESKLELFGTNSYKQTIIPRRLNYLMEVLPIGNTLSKEAFLYEHTWYGLYKVFYEPERINRTLNIIYGEGDNGKVGVGITTKATQSILSADIKYCPICVSEDELLYGEVYVHRGHQIEFLESCPKHNIKLETKCSNCGEVYGNTESGMLLRSSYCNCGSDLKKVKVSDSDEIIQLQYQLHNDLVLLRERHWDINVDILCHQLLGYLYRSKYISLKNIFSKKKMIEDFINHYSFDVLKKFNISKEDISTFYFFATLFKRDSMSNFIAFYLLLIHYFTPSVESFLQDNTEISSPIFYGNGPWACKNERCVNYNVPSIKKCVRKIVNSENEMCSLKYSCDSCGHATLLKGKIDEIYSLSNYKDKYEKKKDSYIDIITGENKRLRETRRTMISILKQGLDSRKKIYLENEAAYTWLMKYDRHWLISRLPPVRDRKARKINFVQLDIELLNKIKNAVGLLDPNYPLRITKQTVSNLLESADRNGLKNYKNLLPLSSQELERHVESRKDFLIRSIPRFYEKFVNRGITSMNIYFFKSATATFYKLNAEENIEIEREIYKFLETQNALIQ